MEILQYHIYEIDVTQSIKGEDLPDDIIYGVILSPKEMNDMLKTIIMAPLSNCCAITPTTFLIDHETRIRLDQISTVPKSKVNKYIGELGVSQIPKIKNVLEEMLVK